MSDPGYVAQLPKTRAAGCPGRRRAIPRRKPCPRERGWTVPTSGVSPPQRLSWQALIDLEPGELRCVQWLLRRLDRRRHVGPGALARECHVRTSTAVKFLRGPWPAWAESVLRSGNAAIVAQVTETEDIERLRVELRETLGNAFTDEQPPDRKKVACR